MVLGLAVEYNISLLEYYLLILHQEFGEKSLTFTSRPFSNIPAQQYSC